MVKKLKLITIINFKTYKEATGARALKLAQVCEKVSKKTKVKIIVAVQATDISVAKKIKIPVLAQHVDYFEQGRHTGKILPEVIKEAGAVGTLVNHSENKLPLKTIKKIIKRCKVLNLLTIVCASSVQQARQIAKLKPYAMAYEVPELIATGKSITKIKPDSVKAFASLFKKTRIIPLCGAGISSHEDVKLALKLGCKGVLVSSASVKAKNQEKVLREFILGI